MGTGSGSSSGSSGSGGSGSGVSSGSTGTYHFDPVRDVRSPKARGATGSRPRRQIVDVLGSARRRKHLVKQFCGGPIAAAYDAAFALGRHPDQAGDALGIDPGPGFLLRLIEELARRWQAEEPDPRLRDAARNTLEDFLVRAVGDDVVIYLQGSREDVRRALDPEVVKSTAGHFVGKLLWRLLEREIERLPAHETEELRKASQETADELLEHFEKRFADPGAGSRAAAYRDLFTTLRRSDAESGKPFVEWFLEGLK